MKCINLLLQYETGHIGLVFARLMINEKGNPNNQNKNVIQFVNNKL